MPLTGLDRAVGDAAVDLRTPALVDVAKAVDLLTAVPLIMVLRWGTVLALAVLGRFRHLVVFLATFVVTDWVVARALHVALEPPDVTVLAEAGTYAFPSLSIAALAITLVGISLVLVPRGAARRTASWLVHGTLLVVVSGRADPGDRLRHPDGLLVGVRHSSSPGRPSERSCRRTSSR